MIFIHCKESRLSQRTLLFWPITLISSFMITGGSEYLLLDINEYILIKACVTIDSQKYVDRNASKVKHTLVYTHCRKAKRNSLERCILYF